MEAPASRDPRVLEILAIVEGLRGDRADEPAADPIEGALAAVDALSGELSALRAAYAEANERFCELTEVIGALVSLDFTRRARVSSGGGDETRWDGLAVSLNELGRMLAESTVTRDFVNDIIESMSDQVVVTGADGLITTANRAALARRGGPELESGGLVGQPLGAIFEGVSGPELLRAGGARDIELAAAAPSGERASLSLTASVMRAPDGELRGLVCVARDVTEEKRSAAERASLREATERQSILLDELSTPLIALSGSVLVMPIIGALDEERARLAAEVLLRGVTERRARAVILDITGLRSADERAASGIARAAHGASLLGAFTVLTGISPEVARLFAEIDVDLRGVQIFSSLARGLRYAVRRIGRSR